MTDTTFVRLLVFLSCLFSSSPLLVFRLLIHATHVTMSGTVLYYNIYAQSDK